MKKIGIAGVGGIGSNVALHLVRAGVKELKFADFDRIEASNLNRQFYFHDQIGLPKASTLSVNLNRVAENLKLESHDLYLTKENMATLFSDCDVIVEGFDKSEMKKILLEVFGNSGKLIVSANGIAGTDTENISVKSIGNIRMVGDFSKDIKEHKTYSYKVGTVAAIMAGIVLKEGGFIV